MAATSGSRVSRRELPGEVRVPLEERDGDAAPGDEVAEGGPGAHYDDAAFVHGFERLGSSVPVQSF